MTFVSFLLLRILRNRMEVLLLTSYWSWCQYCPVSMLNIKVAAQLCLKDKIWPIWEGNKVVQVYFPKFVCMVGCRAELGCTVRHDACILSSPSPSSLLPAAIVIANLIVGHLSNVANMLHVIKLDPQFKLTTNIVLHVQCSPFFIELQTIYRRCFSIT